MTTDKKALLAVVLSVLFYVGYTKYLNQKYPDYAKRQATPTSTESPEVAKETAPEQATAPTPANEPAQANAGMEGYEALSPEELRIETGDAVYEFDQEFAAIKSIRLKNYRAHKDSPAEDRVELLDSPMKLQPTLDIVQELGSRGFQAERSNRSITFSRIQGDWKTSETITVPESGYGLSVRVDFQNISTQPLELTGGLWAQENVLLPKKSGGFIPGAPSEHKTFIAGVDNGRSKEDVKKYCEDGEGRAFSFQDDKIDFIGLDKHYFLNVLQPKSETASALLSKIKEGRTDTVCPIIMTVYQKFGAVQPGESVSMELGGYFGPKDVHILKEHDPKLKQTADFGWFSIIAYPLLLAIKWLYSVTHNYGVAIILMTVALKILFYPLTKAAAVSMKRMQKLQPEMQRIRERNKEDPRRQQQELMQFMAKNKVNPMKGCLPILPQIPVFIAFYNVLSQAIELRHSEFAGWITDLSMADPYYVSPIILGILMFAQQKLTPNPSMDKSQERVMLMLPVVFTVMMLSLPAGMVLYMVTNTVVSIAQQQWLNRRLANVSV